MFKSWRTGLGGVVSILIGVGLVGKAIKNFMDRGVTPTSDEWFLMSTAFVTGWNGLHSRDNKVSDEKAGAKGP